MAKCSHDAGKNENIPLLIKMNATADETLPGSAPVLPPTSPGSLPGKDAQGPAITEPHGQSAGGFRGVAFLMEDVEEALPPTASSLGMRL